MNNIHHVWITTKIPLGLSVTLNLALMLSNLQISYSDLLIMHEMQVQRQKYQWWAMVRLTKITQLCHACNPHFCSNVGKENGWQYRQGIEQAISEIWTAVRQQEENWVIELKFQAKFNAGIVTLKLAHLPVKKSALLFRLRCTWW